MSGELGCCPASHRGLGQCSGYKIRESQPGLQNIEQSLQRERLTMKNIALLSLLTLAILQPLAEAISKIEIQRNRRYGETAGELTLTGYKYTYYPWPAGSYQLIVEGKVL